jgi:N-acetylmuramidase
MNFTGKANPLTQQGLDTVTALLDVGAAEIWTLLSVETQTCGYLADRRPIILFERHIFHQQTGGVYDASNPSVSSPIPGGYLGGTREYDRLQQAMAVDAHAALNSASWGIGQVMGFNSSSAGFPSVESMVTAMIDEEDAQLTAVAHYLLNKKLNRVLAAHQWDLFAKEYNGPNYCENKYDIRLAAAYASLLSGPLPQIPVRQAQVLLTFLGIHTGAIDGLPGQRTSAAVTRFRQQQGLGSSSIIDGPLIEALQRSPVS